MTGWSSAEKQGSAGKSQPPAMLDIIRKGKMPGALRYKIIETGLIGGVTAQAFPGDALNGQRHTFYCGAHLRFGFHEDGLVSALRVTERLGAHL